jgi:hypothetical protein
VSTVFHDAVLYCLSMRPPGGSGFEALGGGTCAEDGGSGGCCSVCDADVAAAEPLGTDGFGGCC